MFCVCVCVYTVSIDKVILYTFLIELLSKTQGEPLDARVVEPVPWLRVWI